MAEISEFYSQAGVNTNGSVPQPSMAPQQAPSISGTGSVNLGLKGQGLPVAVFAVLALVGALILLHIE